EVAQSKAASGGVYKPKLFNEHEYATVRRLSEIIIPADDVSGSAIEAGAPEFIDLIAANNELFATRLVGGIAWLDRAIEKKSGKNFLDSSIPEQTAMLDQIAFKEK